MRITDISVSFEKLENLEAQKAKEEERSKAAAQVAEPDNFPDADWEDDDEEDELGF